MRVSIISQRKKTLKNNQGMDFFDCNSPAKENPSDLNSILISITDMKSESMTTDIMCCDNEMEKDMSSDLNNLDNLDILNSCNEVFPNANAIMDCLSDINQSPDPFDIPTIDADESVLPVFGPYAEFESPVSFETDVLDVNAVAGACGLRNLGNTCFMNAGLQCLLNNKTFKTYFGETELDTFEKGTLCVKFGEIMQKVWSGSYSSLHLGEFKECFGSMYTQFRNFRQHDCQEFLALLLDTMHEEMNTANKNKFKNKIENGQTNNNNSKHISEPASSLKLDFKLDCVTKMEIGKTKTDVETIKNEMSNSDSHIKCMSPNPVEVCEVAMDTDSAANNAMPTMNLMGAVKMKNESDSSSAIYERNTEKMADLLINNKLDTILNKNELDVSSSAETSTNCDLKISAVKRNTIRNVNDVNENNLEKNELASKLNSVHKIPSIEDFVKDTKTLNTNVLVSDETNNLYKFDSEKFPKHDSNRLQETVDNLGQIVDLGTKQGGIKRVKITNIMHEKHGILEQNADQFSSCSTLHKRQKIENIDANLDSPLPEQEEAVDIEQLPCDECSESSSQSSELYALNSECQELLVAEEIRRACNDWDQYKSLNQSIIVDTFHGQFRSSVVCSQCSHNSITYEPFMYLPVFLPHTLERQIVITFVQNNGATPVCYLINVNKYDRILKIREALQRLLDVPAEEIVLAEVFENHISRFLDENQSIRRVNDSTRSVYAFEVGKICEENSEPLKTSNSDENMHLTEEDRKFFNNSNTCKTLSDTLSNNTSDDLFENCDILRNGSSSPSDVMKEENILLATEFLENNSTECASDVEQRDASQIGPVQYHTCAICLEELPNYKLSFHPSCECILCNTCIEVSCKHYGGATFICPVCSSPVAPAEDFMPLTKIGESQYKISTIPIPIVMRHDIFEGSTLKEKILIGHPCLLKLPSSLSASKLYEHVDRAIPFLSTYSLLLVDGQGKHCSRCLYNKHCSGCEITRIGDVKLHPGDNIAVRYIDLTPENLASASYAIEHKSMQQARHKSELDIYDCLEYFSERESLDADSPWFCPVCRRNQQATKSLSVWKFPQVLIIYLKRFVFHDFMSIKVDDKVSYPLEGLDLSSFSSGPFSEDLIYDLQACVCHFGGVSAGHYTSYSKHAVTNEWYYYNDENVKKEAPNTDECVNEYIFFYQKR